MYACVLVYGNVRGTENQKDIRKETENRDRENQEKKDQERRKLDQVEAGV